MNDTRTVKLVREYEYITLNRRDVVRPRKRWKDKHLWGHDRLGMAYTLLVVVVVVVMVMIMIMIMANDNNKF
jgi:hypothetical protein